MSIETSYDLSRINQKRPDNMLVQLNKMQAQIEEMYAAIAAGANSHTSDTDNPHSVTASQVGLGNVDNYDTATQSEAEAGTATDKFMTPQRSKQAIDKQIKGTSWIQENGLYIATDQLRARDSSGLILSDDSGNGLTILDGGNTSLTAGKYHSADSIRARSASGLGLYDDAGQGPKVNDGGIVTNSYQPKFSVTKSAIQENIATGSHVTIVWDSEVYDIGNNFASNKFTAPITGKYHFDVNVWIQSIDSASSFLQLAITTSNREYLKTYDFSKFSGDLSYWAFEFSVDADMDLGDTAYITIKQQGGTVQMDLSTPCTWQGHLII